MSFIIWYKVQIEDGSSAPGGLAGAVASLLGGGLPLKVSNDVFSGQYILDADVKLSMRSGPVVSSFEITLTNLPADVADMLKGKQADGLRSHQPLQVKVYLGYFEDANTFTSPDPVMVGAVTKLKSQVNDAGILEMTLKGEELTGYKLRTKVNTQCSQADQATAESFLQLVLKDTGVTLASGHGLADSAYNFTLDERNALEALRVMAERSRAPVVLRDNQLYVKNAVGGGNPVATFTPDDNIVKLDDAQDGDEDPRQAQANSPTQTTARTSQLLTVLGNPKLRAGVRASVQLKDEPPKQLRITQVDHHFSSTSGYTCDVVVVDAAPGERVTEALSGINAVTDRMRDLVNNNQKAQIDVGEVTDYAPGSQQKHLATLNYGQSPASDAAAPSVDTAVDDMVQLHSKPLASPFAFGKCGLMVPVYPKMRALLAHNRGAVNDAIITGFLWSEHPRLQPPANQPGDYWLCLPTETGSDNLPSGKGVNDLTDSAGKRVVQAKGLHIQVGDSLLPDVGTRPTVAGDLDGQLIIEHKSGTKITVGSDGAVQVQTSSKDISLTNGSVTLKLSGSAVEVS